MTTWYPRCDFSFELETGLDEGLLITCYIYITTTQHYVLSKGIRCRFLSIELSICINIVLGYIILGH